MTQIELSVEAFQELSTFVLCEVFDGPTTWNTLSAKFLERRSVEGDDQFRWLFSRLMCKMLEEHWIEKTSDIYLFEVGITFKGKTVLRHKSEISALYDRHFKCVIEKINRESKSKLKKQQDRVKKNKRKSRSPKGLRRKSRMLRKNVKKI